jgi:hypothetical protein
MGYLSAMEVSPPDPICQENRQTWRAAQHVERMSSKVPVANAEACLPRQIYHCYFTPKFRDQQALRQVHQGQCWIAMGRICSWRVMKPRDRVEQALPPLNLRTKLKFAARIYPIFGGFKTPANTPISRLQHQTFNRRL